jgi:hypothetical protein
VSRLGLTWSLATSVLLAVACNGGMPAAPGTAGERSNLVELGLRVQLDLGLVDIEVDAVDHRLPVAIGR